MRPSWAILALLQSTKRPEREGAFSGLPRGRRQEVMTVDPLQLEAGPAAHVA